MQQRTSFAVLAWLCLVPLVAFSVTCCISVM